MIMQHKWLILAVVAIIAVWYYNPGNILGRA